MRYTVVKMDMRRNTVCFSDREFLCFDSFQDAFDGAIERADEEIDSMIEAAAGSDVCYGIPADSDFSEGRSVKVVLYAENEQRVISERFIIQF